MKGAAIPAVTAALGEAGFDVRSQNLAVIEAWHGDTGTQVVARRAPTSPMGWRFAISYGAGGRILIPRSLPVLIAFLTSEVGGQRVKRPRWKRGRP